MKALRVLPALALVAGFGGQAHAEITPDSAQALQTQLHDWLAGLLQPAVTAADAPFQVTPEGDHFRLTVAPGVPVAGKAALDYGSVSFSARPLDAGRWALDDLRLPGPIRLTGPDLPAPKAAPGRPPGQPIANVTEITTQGLQWHGLIDPSFATTSTLDNAADGIRITGPLTTLSLGKGASHGTLTPDGDGTLTYASQSTIADLRETAALPTGDSVQVSFAKVAGSSTVHGISPATLAEILRDAAALGAQQDGPGATPSPAQHETMLKLVDLLGNVARGAEITGTADAGSFQGNAFTATVRRISFGEDVGTRDGKLSLGLLIGLEGLDSPMIPPGIYRDFLPRKILLKPRISGLSPEDMKTLIRHRVDDGGKDSHAAQAEVMAMFAVSPLNLALEQISFDLGPASLDGTLSADIAGPADVTVDGDITITGLDALIRRANTTPELKQIAPGLIFLKGIGKQDGEDTSFAIRYENGVLKVNDTDLTNMMPGTKP